MSHSKGTESQAVTSFEGMGPELRVEVDAGSLT